MAYFCIAIDSSTRKSDSSLESVALVAAGPPSSPPSASTGAWIEMLLLGVNAPIFGVDPEGRNWLETTGWEGLPVRRLLPFV